MNANKRKWSQMYEFILNVNKGAVDFFLFNNLNKYPLSYTVDRLNINQYLILGYSKLKFENCYFMLRHVYFRLFALFAFSFSLCLSSQ